MPWKTTIMNDQRREFVTRALQAPTSFAALCREFGISRKTGYKWKERALADGLKALGEHSRRPKSNPKQLDETTTCALIRLRLRHPTWGPKKLRSVYARDHSKVPSISTCQRVLMKAGLVVPRRRRARGASARLTIGAVAKAPNDVWTVDFKGWWHLGDGCRCEPLTVRDAFSRFVLAVRVPAGTNTASIQAEFVRIFQTYGLPKVIRSDNGSPFAARNSPLGLSRLSAWWVTLGIELDRGRPAHPQDNGGHERMHKDMEAEIARHVQPNAKSQQAACEVWREEFNWERPHDALGGKRPGDIYRKSNRLFRTPAGKLEYGPGYFPRKVSPCGLVKWRGESVFVSTALTGCEVGVRIAASDTLEVWLNYLLLGTIELQTRSFRAAPSRVPEAPRVSA